MSEKELIQKLKSGDESSFKELVTQNQSRVLNTCYRFVNNREDAEDIAQEVFIEVYHSISSFRGEAKLTTWIYRIAVNVSIDVKRSKSRKRQIMIENVLEDSENFLEKTYQDKGPQPDQLLELKDLNEQIEKALTTLPSRQRVAFVLRHFHDRSMEEIANILDCKAGTVRSHIFRAINKLKNELKEFQTP